MSEQGSCTLSEKLQETCIQKVEQSMDMHENSTVLQQQTLTPVEIERLLQLCQTLWKREALVVRRRLEFIGWLVPTGRINEQAL